MVLFIVCPPNQRTLFHNGKTNLWCKIEGHFFSTVCIYKRSHLSKGKKFHHFPGEGCPCASLQRLTILVGTSLQLHSHHRYTVPRTLN